MPITPSSATSGKTGIPPPPSLTNHANYTNSNGASATSASATANHTKTLSDASWSSASAAARKHSTNSSPSPVAAATMRSRRLNGPAAGEGDPSGNHFPGTPSRSGLTPERRTLRTQPNFSADLGETF
ncbi:hypothetical protein KEM55_000434 [Ascosphaera atra]|nr:hypothetical protein KEM55_000434 [Ascosphaera atra]